MMMFSNAAQASQLPKRSEPGSGLSCLWNNTTHLLLRRVLGDGV